jgi:hypothetical protein
MGVRTLKEVVGNSCGEEDEEAAAGKRTAGISSDICS